MSSKWSVKPSRAATLSACAREPLVKMNFRPGNAAIAAQEALADGDELVLRIHRQPYPLYDMLRNEGYCYQCEPTEDGLFRITISRPA